MWGSRSKRTGNVDPCVNYYGNPVIASEAYLSRLGGPHGRREPRSSYFTSISIRIQG